MKVRVVIWFGLDFINGREILRDFEKRNNMEYLRKMTLEGLCRTERGEITKGPLCWGLLPNYFW